MAAGHVSPPLLEVRAAGRSRLMVPPSKRPKTDRQSQRATFVGTYLLTGGDLAAAQKASGLKDPHYLQRLGQLLLDTGGLADRPRSGRKRKYTDEHCAAAQRELTTGSAVYPSTDKLVANLRSTGELPEDTKARPFKRRLQEHLKEQQLQLKYGEQSMGFAVNEQQAAKRKTWCQDHLEELSSEEGLRSWAFEDETTIEESPHPKGKAWRWRDVIASALVPWKQSILGKMWVGLGCIVWCTLCSFTVASMQATLGKGKQTGARTAGQAIRSSTCPQLCIQLQQVPHILQARHAAQQPDASIGLGCRPEEDTTPPLRCWR